MKNGVRKYKLFEVGDPADGGRRFLYNCENDHIAELSKVVDETAGREAIILNRNIPYDVRRRLFGFCTDGYMVDHDALAPSPIWNYHSLERDPNYTVVELRKLPDSFTKNSLFRLL